MINKLFSCKGDSDKMFVTSSECGTRYYPVHDAYCSYCNKCYDMHSVLRILSGEQHSWKIKGPIGICPRCAKEIKGTYQLAIDELDNVHVFRISSEETDYE